MSLPTRIRARLRTLSKNVTSAMAQGHQVRTRGPCPHCEQRTAWLVRPTGGVYRCLRCERDPFASRPTPADAVSDRSSTGRLSLSRVRRVANTLAHAAAIAQTLWDRATAGLARAFSSHAAWSARANASGRPRHF